MSDYAVESNYADDGDAREERTCPECHGRAYDRSGLPCDFCYGEGVILIFP